MHVRIHINGVKCGSRIFYSVFNNKGTSNNLDLSFEQCNCLPSMTYVCKDNDANSSQFLFKTDVNPFDASMIALEIGSNLML